MLACLDGVDTSAYGKCRFTDVSDKSVFAPYVEWAANNGIVLGIDSATFKPNDNITREQMAAIICRYADYAGIKLSDDAPAAAFADSAADIKVRSRLCHGAPARRHNMRKAERRRKLQLLSEIVCNARAGMQGAQCL